jgi:hypothetical protein
VNPLRRIASLAGWLFIITFVASIPAFFICYKPLLDHPNYIVGAGADNRIALGALLEMILIIANIGTAVVLFPILKRQNESLALGYVTARVMESAFIAVGILSLMAVVTLRQDVGAAGGDSLVIAGRSLVAVHDWTFLLGPGWVVGVENGLILGYLKYRSGLVPRGMAMLGLIGGPLIILSGTLELFDVIEPGSGAQVIATVPEFFWELSLGIYLMVKGFKPSPITAGNTGPVGGGRVRPRRRQARPVPRPPSDPDSTRHGSEPGFGRAPTRFATPVLRCRRLESQQGRDCHRTWHVVGTPRDDSCRERLHVLLACWFARSPRTSRSSQGADWRPMPTRPGGHRVLTRTLPA